MRFRSCSRVSVCCAEMSAFWRASSKREAETKLRATRSACRFLVAQGEGVPCLRLRDFGLLLAVACLHRGEVGAHLSEFRVGLADGDLEGRRVDAQQRLAGGDDLVLLHQYVADDAGDVGGDGNLVGLDVGVLGLDVTTAAQVDDAGDEQHDRRHDDEQQAPLQAALASGGRIHFIGHERRDSSVRKSFQGGGSRASCAARA